MCGKKLTVFLVKTCHSRRLSVSLAAEVPRSRWRSVYIGRECVGERTQGIGITRIMRSVIASENACPTYIMFSSMQVSAVPPKPVQFSDTG